MKSYPVAFYTFFGYIFKTESRVFGGVNKDKENARRKIRRAPFLYTTNSAVSHAYFFLSNSPATTFNRLDHVSSSRSRKHVHPPLPLIKFPVSPHFLHFA